MDVTVRVDHRLDRDQLIACLAWNERDWSPRAGELPRLSAEEVVGAIRETLRAAGGEKPTYWRDDAWPPNEETIEEWATETVDRVFGSQLRR